ncbi:MAG: CHASE3 domain-containing protein [Mycolicibacterium hassiacum]|uniref:sensor histidine kinase n=1 Tax=Mycolicibacterium hassiacum TaxID=46351 RepID=UPI0023F950B0|nr:sensor histidine kinase [Mycolicibacterium hassiacum]MBX5486406.1 CHASE3 domain-containing protein [Mycolicibacterium hassiacum]
MRRRPTVQGWQNLVLLSMGALVLAGAVGGALLLNRYDDMSRRLTEHIQPARIAAYQLQAALRDQETAVRGYAIAAEPLFLQPYYTGEETERAATQEIRDVLAEFPELIADVDAIERAADEWRSSFAEPLIARIKPGTPGVIDPATSDRGRALFDGIRRLFDVQNAHLAEARQHAVDEIDRVRVWRDSVLIGMVATFFVAALALAVIVRNAVNRPLEALARSCRNITSGNFDDRIVPQGPSDIRAIAADVEDMRQRIVAELEASHTARSRLAEQAQELQRSNAELEQFAYVASHDLQEPLRKVASFCQLIEKRYGDKLDERGVEYISFAVDGAKRMQVLINDLLTFSRVGRISAQQTEVDMDTVIDDALANLDTAIKESGAQIVRRGASARLTGDPTLLTMLWQNLIGNAIKFRRENVAPRVQIDCEQASDGWEFAVSDNGIGIPAEFADKVFVIFQRLHGRDSYTGTGIGLALCKKIVEHHGGTIWIDSSYTDGTRFRFTIPTDPAAEPAAADTTDPEGATH